MSDTKPQNQLLTESQRRAALTDIIDFFANERDEEIGIIAAEAVLDALMESVGNTIYNKGVDDTKNYITSRMEEITVDLEGAVKKGTS